MWIDRTGRNHTAADICRMLHNACGAAYTPDELSAAYRIGAIIDNGGLWFQRLS